MASTSLQCLRLLVLLGFCFAIATSSPTRRAQSPLTDPFYVPPAGFENEEPGTVLRSRTVISSLLGLVPTVGVTTYQILYRTTAINGSAIAGITTVLKPLNAQTDKFVSFQTAYDGASPTCGPSYQYQLLSPQTDLILSAEFLLVELFLASGYIVSAPDYEGPDAAFTAGRLSGMGVLDSMRAVSNFHSTLGLTSATPKVVGYGYSGGALATGWAASLQSTYAPELPVLAWAHGGTPANLSSTALFIDNSPFSGFLPIAIDGLSKPSAYGAELAPKIASIITPYGQSKLDYANNNCITSLFNFFEMSFLSTKVQSLGPQLFFDPVIQNVMSRTVMGAFANETPTAPVYLFHTTTDEIIPYANASTLADRWCGYGAAVDFVTIASGGHFTGEVVGFFGAFQFLQNAFAGKVATSGCTRSTIYNSTLNPVAFGLDLEPIALQLIDALVKFGEGDSNVINDIRTLSETVST